MLVNFHKMKCRRIENIILIQKSRSEIVDLPVTRRLNENIDSVIKMILFGKCFRCDKNRFFHIDR